MMWQFFITLFIVNNNKVVDYNLQNEIITLALLGMKTNEIVDMQFLGS